MRNSRRRSVFRNEEPEQTESAAVESEDSGLRSRVVLIVVAVALVAGFFILGYNIGNFRDRSTPVEEKVTPLPDIASSKEPEAESKSEAAQKPEEAPKPEEYTFYETLSAKDDKTVPVQAKPQQVAKSDQKRTSSESDRSEAKAPEAHQEKMVAGAGKEEKPAPAKPKAVIARSKEEPTKQATRSSSTAKRRYTVQTASFREKASAETEVQRLKKKGYAAFFTAMNLPGKGMRYRVRIGSFPDRGAAEKLQKKLHKKEGMSPIIAVE